MAATPMTINTAVRIRFFNLIWGVRLISQMRGHGMFVAPTPSDKLITCVTILRAVFRRGLFNHCANNSAVQVIGEKYYGALVLLGFLDRGLIDDGSIGRATKKMADPMLACGIS